MPHYVLHHRHEPAECSIAFAAWQGFESPLRHRLALCSCLAGDHAVWWRATALDAASALRLLPPYVAQRTTAIAVREVEIP
jgi:hypothetical protein